MTDSSSDTLPYSRHHFGVVRPYLYGGLDVADFIVSVFDAKVLERHKYEDRHAFHIEFQIADSVVVLEASEPPHESAASASIYVYVPDVDAAYERAMDLNATSILVPTDQVYKERSAGVRDSFGNRWWIATYRPSPQT